MESNSLLKRQSEMDVENLSLRVALPEDSERIFMWRNRPEIVALGSLNRQVSEEEHSSWFEETIRGEHRCLYIVQLRNEAIGQVRFDWHERQRAEVSIYLLSEFTNRGLGVAALREGSRRAFESGQADKIVSYVRHENPRSLAAFLKAGFVRCMTEEAKPGHDCLCLFSENRTVPHNRLTHGEEEVRAVDSVIRSGNWARGPVSDLLETRLAECAGMQGAATVGSGLGALRLALLALGIADGDKVAVPAYSCVALANAVLACGAEPVPVDVEPDTWNISPTALRGAVGGRSNVQAIIAVHTFGMPASIGELTETGIPVIEDCSHAFGMAPFGSLGKVSILSLFSTKLLGSGEGGALLSNDEKILAYGHHGRDYADKAPSRHSLNDRATDIEASLALCQLDRLPAMIEQREMLAGRYQKILGKHLAAGSDIHLPLMTSGRIWYRFAVSVPDAAGVVGLLKQQGIAAAQPVDNWLADKLDGYPVSARACRCLVSLPLYPTLGEVEQDRVIEAFLQAVSKDQCK